jgi:hypothetical protein
MSKPNLAAEFETAAEQWLDANPRRMGERRLQYARRAQKAVRGELEKKHGSLDWIALLPFLFKIIEWLMSRKDKA